MYLKKLLSTEKVLNIEYEDISLNEKQVSIKKEEKKKKRKRIRTTGVVSLDPTDVRSVLTTVSPISTFC